MISASSHPFGARLFKNSRVKLRMVNLIHTYNACYADMWNAGWSTARMTTMINAAALVKANSVKLFCSGLTETSYDGGSQKIGGTAPSDAVLRSRLQWTFQQLRNIGLKVYFGVLPTPTIGYGGTTSTNTANFAITQKILQWVMADAPDLLVAFELCNELNQVMPGAWTAAGSTTTKTSAVQVAWAQQLVAAARAVVRDYVPITFSCYISNLNDLGTNPYIGLQHSLAMDFHDFHPYYQIGNYNPAGQMPAATDIALKLWTRSDYIGRNLMGENGCGMTYYDGTVTPPAYQTKWINGLGDMCRDIDSFGGNFFVLGDYHDSDTDNFGMFDKNFLNPRLQVIKPFGRWPANL